MAADVSGNAFALAWWTENRASYVPKPVSIIDGAMAERQDLRDSNQYQFERIRVRLRKEGAC